MIVKLIFFIYNQSMQGTVYKIHSDFYYVKNSKHESFVCKVREILKKQNLEITVGDFVEFSQNPDYIISRLDRINSLTRPKCSNIDCCLIITPLKEPELDLVQLNRYLAFLKYNNIEAAICFNKEDLLDDPSDIQKELSDIYTDLGYKVFFISAKVGLGLDEVLKFIKNKTIALCGQSGAGKTTLLKRFNPEILSKTQVVSAKTKRGQHTTRHCEIFDCDGFNIIDTPGFSRLKFDFLLPDELLNLFSDIKKYADSCKYANCLHNVDTKGICSVYDNLDKIEKSRYESYLTFLDEALEYKKEISKKSIKDEKSFKNTGNKTVAKISKRKRTASRNTDKQKIKKEKNVD